VRIAFSLSLSPAHPPTPLFSSPPPLPSVFLTLFPLLFSFHRLFTRFLSFPHPSIHIFFRMRPMLPYADSQSFVCVCVCVCICVCVYCMCVCVRFLMTSLSSVCKAGRCSCYSSSVLHQDYTAHVNVSSNAWSDAGRHMASSMLMCVCACVCVCVCVCDTWFLGFWLFGQSFSKCTFCAHSW